MTQAFQSGPACQTATCMALVRGSRACVSDALLRQATANSLWARSTKAQQQPVGGVVWISVDE